MQCLTDIGTGSYQIANPQPTVTNNCTYLIVQPNEIPTAFMNMTPEQGLEVGGLFALVLVVGFTFRAVAQALHVPISNNGDSNES